ncbi:hypothetical protein [Phenylobacterium sp.]|uniref:hypothetical protein n=1 Tax=Phenylobacterium sp. TaxID=1871053 RepID=UPI00391AFD2A
MLLSSLISAHRPSAVVSPWRLARRACVALGAIFALASCSHPLKVDLTNGSGVELRFHTYRASRSGTAVQEIVTIKPGRKRIFEFAEVLLPGDRVLMEAGGCEVAYHVTEAHWRQYPRINHLELLVQPDLSMRHIGSASHEDDELLKPVSRVCP